jgi:hypothetical protein
MLKLENKICYTFPTVPLHGVIFKRPDLIGLVCQMYLSLRML